MPQTIIAGKSTIFKHKKNPLYRGIFYSQYLQLKLQQFFPPRLVFFVAITIATVCPTIPVSVSIAVVVRVVPAVTEGNLQPEARERIEEWIVIAERRAVAVARRAVAAVRIDRRSIPAAAERAEAVIGRVEEEAVELIVVVAVVAGLGRVVIIAAAVITGRVVASVFVADAVVVIGGARAKAQRQRKDDYRSPEKHVAPLGVIRSLGGAK